MIELNESVTKEMNKYLDGITIEEILLLKRKLFHFQVNFTEEQMNQVFVRSALMCRAEGAVISVQDWLGLGHEARINDPSHQPDNWFWRLGEPLLTAELAARIFELTRRYGRLNWENEYVRNVMNA